MLQENGKQQKIVRKHTNEVSGAMDHPVVPVEPYGLSQCHASSGKPDHGCPVSCLYSSQMWHHCLWPTARTEHRKGPLATATCRRAWSYLPGHMTHGHVMSLHAGLTAVVWSVSYFVGGGGSTVYPPLGKSGHGE